MIVREPLYACAAAVFVQGFVPGADVTVLVDGSAVTTVSSVESWGIRIQLPTPLVEGQVVSATQTFGGVTSLPSEEVTVRSHTEDYPHGFAAPTLDTPVLTCGKAIGVRNIVQGSLLQVYSETLIPDGTFDPPVEVGRVNGSGTGQWLFVSPEFAEGNRITANFTLCSDQSPLSAAEIVQPEPATIPTPTVDPEIYENGQIVVVRDVVNGAVIDVFADGSRVGGHAAPGGSQRVRINPPASAGQTMTAAQELCNRSPESPGVTVLPCAELPPAKIRTPSAGDDRVEVTDYVPGSRILIFANGEEVGDGGGPLIQLSRPIQVGEEIVVVQRLGDCESSWIQVVEALCLAPETVSDPSGGGSFDVGRLDYELPEVPIDTDDAARLWATVRYPALSDGTDSEIASGPSRFPLVMVLHGNHGIFRDGGEDVCGGAAPGSPEVANHEGYDYVLESLARAGIIAVSINANDLNCLSDRIRERGTLILEHLALWKRLDDPAASEPLFSGKFHNRIDLERIGLAGHSRGGEAVVSAALNNGDPDLVIRAVLSLAPTDFHGLVHDDLPLLMVLPAADGDVWTNAGAKIYDRAPRGADEEWFKSQMYAYGAVHNLFNREWLKNDWDQIADWCAAGFSHTFCGATPPPNQLGRPAHEGLLRAWARGFFGLTLLNEAGFLPAFSGDGAFAVGASDRVFPSYVTSDALTVDDYEQSPDDVTENSLSGVVTPTAGFSVLDEFDFTQTSADRFDDAFFHETDGLVAQWPETGPSFTSDIPVAQQNVSRFEYLSLRVTQPAVRANSAAEVMDFSVGLLDASGNRVDVEVTVAGVIPFPYTHPGGNKSMLRTLRVPLACFAPAGVPAVRMDSLRQLIVTFDQLQDGVVGLDQLEFSR